MTDEECIKCCGLDEKSLARKRAWVEEPVVWDKKTSMKYFPKRIKIDMPIKTIDLNSDDDDDDDDDESPREFTPEEIQRLALALLGSGSNQ